MGRSGMGTGTMNRKQYVHENVVHNFMKDEDGNVINTIQNYVDLAAMGLDFVPVVGTVAGSVLDAGSALVDVAQGEYGDAALRGIQAIPGVGSAALATKLGAKGIGKMTGKALTSTPSKVATSAAGFAPGLVGGGEDSGEEGVDDELKSSEKTAAQTASDSQELVRNFAASQLLGNKRIVKHGALQTFESVSSDITRCLLESVGQTVTKMIDGKPYKFKPKPNDTGIDLTPERSERIEIKHSGVETNGPRRGGDGPDTPNTKNKKARVLASLLSPGLGIAALGAFGVPFAISKLYGSDTSAPAGQGPGSKGDGDMPAQGGVASVLDRLSAISGFIPGFNPAGVALGALGRRIGA